MRVIPSGAKSRKRFKLPEETSVLIALVVLIGIVGALRPTFLKPCLYLG